MRDLPEPLPTWCEAWGCWTTWQTWCPLCEQFLCDSHDTGPHGCLGERANDNDGRLEQSL